MENIHMLYNQSTYIHTYKQIYIHTYIGCLLGRLLINSLFTSMYILNIRELLMPADFNSVIMYFS